MVGLHLLFGGEFCEIFEQRTDFQVETVAQTPVVETPHSLLEAFSCVISAHWCTIGDDSLVRRILCIVQYVVHKDASAKRYTIQVHAATLRLAVGLVEVVGGLFDVSPAQQVIHLVSLNWHATCPSE